MSQSATVVNQPEPPLSRSVSGGAILSVFAVNILILGYAVSISAPATDETNRVEAQGVARPEQPAPESQAAPLLNPAAGNVAYSSDAEFPSDEETEWTLEPLKVVNVFDLPDPEEVRPLYIHHCAGCHGVKGQGDGPAADLLLPQPRDFVGSVFRYASFGSDREHVLSDLERTIGHGVPRSAMPGFGGVLAESEIAGLARYVLTFREQGVQQALPEDSIATGARPPITPELIARGRELYTSYSCNTCHGDSGRGDGMNAESLVDFQGRPVRPADFTSGLFKTGQTPEDLCQTILSGVPGTPMVAYEAVLTRENDDEEESVNTLDAWAIVAYIRSLAPREKPRGVRSGAVIVAETAPDEAMLTDPSHVAWLGIEPTVVQLKPLRLRLEKTTSIAVRVVRSADRIAICLDWRDDSLDIVRREGLFSDAVSIMFGLSDRVPALPMGVETVEPQSHDPVNIWLWKADRQYDSTTGRWHSSISLADTAEQGWYLFVPGAGARVPRLAEDEDASPRELAVHDSASDLTDDDLNAIQNDPHQIEHSVLEANALGNGQVVFQPNAGQGACSTGAWSKGLWRVVMVRSLSTDDDQDVQFTSTRKIPLSFAVWNGARGDHEGIKLVSSWHWIEVNP